MLSATCNQAATIRVTIGPSAVTADDPDSTGQGTYSADGRYMFDDGRPPNNATYPTIGAVLNSTFTVTATPVKNSHEECAAVTEETELVGEQPGHQERRPG